MTLPAPPALFPAGRPARLTLPVGRRAKSCEQLHHYLRAPLRTLSASGGVAGLPAAQRRYKRALCQHGDATWPVACLPWAASPAATASHSGRGAGRQAGVKPRTQTRPANLGRIAHMDGGAGGGTTPALSRPPGRAQWLGCQDRCMYICPCCLPRPASHLPGQGSNLCPPHT